MRILGVVLLSCVAAAGQGEIRVCEGAPGYWEYGGSPVLLLGGSVEDNLFQIPDLEAHLDLLKSVGGNYVRNTMSARDDGNVWAFKLVEGKYDLEQWSEEYWRRFETFLELTSARGIIVQIEVWATFDYYRDCWARNPFNPKNNTTYTAEESGLPVEVDSHPTARQNNFFWSVPAERNQRVVLKYQQRFVDNMLSYSLRFGNVLYCMDNETAVTAEWGKYWSEYIKTKAAEAGVSVCTTEMWDPWDLSHAAHSATFDHPETYAFVDVSQNNHKKGQTHWDNAQKQRRRIAGRVRPMNNVKIYGADGGRFGEGRDGMERFWRNVLGGMASARFHRPDSGLGLNEEARANIQSARMLTDAMDVLACSPHNDLLSDREANEAYCLANPGREYALYFPDGGEVVLDVTGLASPATLRWLRVLDSEWREVEDTEAGRALMLRCPSKDYWAVLVQPKDEG